MKRLGSEQKGFASPNSINSRRRIFSVLAYLSYGVVLVLVFLYLTFPFGKIDALLTSKMGEVLACRIQVGESERLFPLGLAWREVSVDSCRDLEGRLRIDRVTAQVHLLPLFSRRIEIDILTHAYGGEVRATLEAQRREDHIQYRLKKTGRDLDLEAIGSDLALGLKGRLQFDLETSWEDQDLERAVGFGDVELLEAELQAVSIRGIEVPALPFLRIAARLNLRNSLVTLQDFRAEGSFIEAAGRGTVLFRNHWSDGILNLTSDIQVKEAFRQRFPLAGLVSGGQNPMKVIIKGTLRRPVVSVNGMSLNL